MNRIRKYANKYQLLITPTQSSNAGFELIRGDMPSFDDSFLRNYSILTFNTLGEAQAEAFNYPDIDWDSLVLLHQNAYIDIKNLILQDMRAFNITSNIESHMMDSLELKNSVFDRVMIYGDRFNLSYQMNDIISFSITNMWTKNLDEIASHLVNDDRLRIKKVKKLGGLVILIGLTDLSTAYEIRLLTHVFDNYIKWTKKYNIVDENIKKSMFAKCIQQQKNIDNGIVIR
jgi:hypothetical protein